MVNITRQLVADIESAVKSGNAPALKRFSVALTYANVHPRAELAIWVKSLQARIEDIKAQLWALARRRQAPSPVGICPRAIMEKKQALLESTLAVINGEVARRESLTGPVIIKAEKPVVAPVVTVTPAPVPVVVAPVVMTPMVVTPKLSHRAARAARKAFTPQCRGQVTLSSFEELAEATAFSAHIAENVTEIETAIEAL